METSTKIGLLLCVGIVSTLAAVALSRTSARTYAPHVDTAKTYAEIHTLDPLFAFPGTETEALKSAVAAFKISAEVALPPYANEELRGSVFPFTFLLQIPATEEARRKLIASPSRKAAQEYHASLQMLLSRYEENLTKAEVLLRTTNDTRQYAFISGTSSAATIEASLKEAQRGVSRIQETENKRWRCFEGEVSSCESIPMLRQNFGSVQKDPASSLKEEALSSEAVLTVAILERVLPATASITTVSLTRSACFSGSPSYIHLREAGSRLSGVPTLSIHYVNDLYVYDLQRSHHPFLDALKKEGAAYSYQPFNIYLCPDANADLSQALSIRYLKRELLEKPIHFKSGYLPPALLEIKAAQEKYTQQTVLSETDFHAVTTAMSEAIRTLDDGRLSAYVRDQKDVLRIKEYATLARAKTGDLELLIGYFDDLQIGSFLPNQFQPVDLSTLFIVRGGIGELYQFSNDTGPHNSNTPLVSKENFNKNPSQHQGVVMRSYHNDLKANMTPEMLVQQLQYDVMAKERAFGSLIEKLKAARDMYSERLRSCTKVALTISEVKGDPLWTTSCN